jgi:hypothetical protein
MNLRLACLALVAPFLASAAEPPAPEFKSRITLPNLGLLDGEKLHASIDLLNPSKSPSDPAPKPIDNRFPIGAQLTPTLRYTPPVLIPHSGRDDKILIARPGSIDFKMLVITPDGKTPAP